MKLSVMLLEMVSSEAFGSTLVEETVNGSLDLALRIVLRDFRLGVLDIDGRILKYHHTYLYIHHHPKGKFEQRHQAHSTIP